jgi:hypothetical protein
LTVLIDKIPIYSKGLKSHKLEDRSDIPDLNDSMDSIHSDDQNEEAIQRDYDPEQPQDDISPPLDSGENSEDDQLTDENILMKNKGDNDEDSPVPEDEHKEDLLIYPKDDM